MVQTIEICNKENLNERSFDLHFVSIVGRRRLIHITTVRTVKYVYTCTLKFMSPGRIWPPVDAQLVGSCDRDTESRDNKPT
jgi:hypothetical protein